jgi:hypothetical protein
MSDVVRRCGDYVLRGEYHERVPMDVCPRAVTRISHAYDGLAFYVCDAPFTGDHEDFAPFLEDSVQDLPDAAEKRAREAS